jgi:hypothetical protein
MEKLVKTVKGQITRKDYHWLYDRDAEIAAGRNGITLTVGANGEGDWKYETGTPEEDWSRATALRRYPFWAQVGIFRDTNSRVVAREIVEEIKRQEGWIRANAPRLLEK